MPGVYQCDLAPVELYPGRTAIRPVLPAEFSQPGNKQYDLLWRYNYTTQTGKAIIICTLVGATGPGLVEVFSGATIDAMRISGRGGGLNNPRRNQMNNWVTQFNQIAPGPGVVVLDPIPNTITNPGDAINFLVQQENPAFDVYALEF